MRGVSYCVGSVSRSEAILSVELDLWLEWLEWYRRILNLVPERVCRNVGFLVYVTAGVRAQARGGTNRGMEITIVPRIWL